MRTVPTGPMPPGRHRPSAARAPALFALSVLGGAVAGIGLSLALGLAAPGTAHGATGAAGAALALVERDAPEDARVPVTPDADIPVGPVGEAATWARTVARVADSVVSLKLSQLRDFDDAEQGISTATGFVVDADRGIVLTNRHVVGSGPIRVSATFQNQERVDAVPLYRDPVHDFAFIRYDPKALKYASPKSLRLRPDKVRTGMSIRVIGSDGGEQLSILPGTIARLDREVPSYGRYGYNDFNTFYLQAASGTSGGSSGSPVIDLAGDVVALNAAANRDTASSFFLPLPRIVHALTKLQASSPISRGGFETLFTQRPFRELSRLGLDARTEARVRREDVATNGMLQVQQVIPGGAGDGALEAGDVLVSVDGATVTDFVELEAMLDARVGRSVPLELVRQGARVRTEATVTDLHAIAPDRFVELGDAVLQAMSIQHARAMNLPRSGVVLMQPGYFFTRAGVPRGAVVRNVGGRDVATLDDFLGALRATPAGEKATLRYVVPGKEFTEEAARVEVDERWFDHRSCERVDGARFWRCLPVSLSRDADDRNAPAAAAFVPSYADPVLDRVAPGLVKVDFHVPFPTDNVYARHFAGVGLVLDADEGLVAVDRNTVPVGLGDAEITFFGSQRIDAEVVYVHPRHNLALLSYDPAALGGAALRALELAPVNAPPPERPTMIGYRNDGTLRASRVDTPSRLTVSFEPPGLPRFQQSALDVYGVDDVPPSLGGPIVDADGTVHGLYMSFAYESRREIRQSEFAMPAHVLTESLRLYRNDEPYRSLDVRLAYRPLAFARELGLPDERLRSVLALPAEARRTLYVEQVVPNTHAAKVLRAGDIVLAIDGRTLSNLFDAERHSQKASVTLDVLRDGEVTSVELRPSTVSARGTDRLVSWAGALFQAPHPDIAWEKGVDFPGVYIADTAEGSPALWDELWRNRFVTAVDGVAVTNLDEFLDAVGAKRQDEITRLSTVSMAGRRAIVTVQPEYGFWPTFEIRRTDAGWRRIGYLN